MSSNMLVIEPTLHQNNYLTFRSYQWQLARKMKDRVYTSRSLSVLPWTYMHYMKQLYVQEVLTNFTYLTYYIKWVKTSWTYRI